MSNLVKLYTFEEAVKTGKHFKCTETGEVFKNYDHLKSLVNENDQAFYFNKDWLNRKYELITQSVTITDEQFDEAFIRAKARAHFDYQFKDFFKQEIGFIKI